jgi:tRNA(Arg) A34 adenosine deaminase TadA
MTAIFSAPDEKFMQRALALARAAGEVLGEVLVGAVLVADTMACHRQ